MEWLIKQINIFLYNNLKAVCFRQHQTNGLAIERNRTHLSSIWGGKGRDGFLLTCALSAQEGQWGHLSWSWGVNSEETNHHLSGPIDFHMKSKYIYSVCAASQPRLPVRRPRS